VTDSGTKPVRVGGANAKSQEFATWPGVKTAEAAPAKRRSGIRRWFLPMVGAVMMAFFLIPCVVFAAVYKQSRTDEAHPADAIVVLGAAQFNGVPSQVFRARLDTAFDLYQQGLAPLMVVTGGRIYGDQYTEAESGRTYLIDRGVPADVILMENVSHNTAASFEGVEKLLKPRGVQSLLIVSDGFHLYRSKMLARNAGFDAYGFAAEDSPIRQGSPTELRYMVRETFGVLAWKLHIKR
jgi:vancomycin permeability regulator SanA